MKQGAPIRDVNMDTGISVAMTDLAAVSIMSINRAPDAILAGTTDRLSFPNIMRTMWGMRSPIQPSCPHMETTAAVTMAAPRITRLRILFTGMPRDFASSSGSDMVLSFHLKRNKSRLPARIKGAPIIRVVLVGDVAEQNLSFGNSRQIRIIFDGRESSEPVIANMVLACKVPVNIMHADTRDIEGKAMGQMIIQLPEDDTDAGRICNYLKTANVKFEEVR